MNLGSTSVTLLHKCPIQISYQQNIPPILNYCHVWTYCKILKGEHIVGNKAKMLIIKQR